MHYPVLDQYLLSQFLEMENLGELNESSVHTLNQLIQKYDLKLFINLISHENSFCLTNKGDSEKVLKVQKNPVYIKSMRYSKPWLSKSRVNINVIYVPSNVDDSKKLLFPFKWVEFPSFDYEAERMTKTKKFGEVTITRFPENIYISNDDYQKYKDLLNARVSEALPAPEQDQAKKKIPIQERRIKKLESYLIALGLSITDSPLSKDEHGFESREECWNALRDESPEVFGLLGKKAISDFFDNQRLVKFKKNKGVLKKHHY